MIYIMRCGRCRKLKLFFGEHRIFNLCRSCVKECEHSFLPIKYGMLMKKVDKAVNIIPPKDYIEGGCVMDRRFNFQCIKCKKKVATLGTGGSS